MPKPDPLSVDLTEETLADLEVAREEFNRRNPDKAKENVASFVRSLVSNQAAATREAEKTALITAAIVRMKKMTVQELKVLASQLGIKAEEVEAARSAPGRR